MMDSGCSRSMTLPKQKSGDGRPSPAGAEPPRDGDLRHVTECVKGDIVGINPNSVPRAKESASMWVYMLVRIGIN